MSGVNQLSGGREDRGRWLRNLAEKIAEAGDGASQLAAGSGEAEVGSKQLADGLVDAADGSGRLADGNRQIADGAGDLAAVSTTAAGGSGQLADGLEKAADGAPALVDGAQRLSDEGTSQLVKAGNDTALEFGENYAIIAAMQEMTKDGGLPYGAPAERDGSLRCVLLRARGGQPRGIAQRDARAARPGRAGRRRADQHGAAGPLRLNHGLIVRGLRPESGRDPLTI